MVRDYTNDQGEPKGSFKSGLSDRSGQMLRVDLRMLEEERLQEAAQVSLQGELPGSWLRADAYVRVTLRMSHTVPKVKHFLEATSLLHKMAVVMAAAAFADTIKFWFDGWGIRTRKGGVKSSSGSMSVVNNDELESTIQDEESVSVGEASDYSFRTPSNETNQHGQSMKSS